MAHHIFNLATQNDLLNDDYSPRNHPNYTHPDASLPLVGLGVRYEVLTFGTTDKKRSLEDCFNECRAYDEAMAELGLFKPSIDYITGEVISVKQRYDYWADPKEPTQGNSRTGVRSRSASIFAESTSPASPRPQSSARFSPTPAQLAAFPALGAPRPDYAPITGTGVFYERIEPTAAQLAMASTSAPGSGYMSVHDISVKTYRSNSQKGDDAYETSSLSSSSYLHDSPSPLDLNEDLSSSDTASNVADIDENDSTSQYSSDSDDSNDADSMAQRAAEGRLGTDMDHETHLVSGDIITSDGEVIHVGTCFAKPSIAFHKLKESKVTSMLPEFLAQMEAANRELEAEKSAGTLASRRIEIDDEAAQSGPFIEMNLGLGVLEDVADNSNSSSESEESEEDQGVLAKLMGASRKRARDDDDAAEETEVGLQKRFKFIEEL